MVAVTPVTGKNVPWSREWCEAVPIMRTGPRCARVALWPATAHESLHRWRTHIIYFQWFFVTQLVLNIITVPSTFELRWSMKQLSGNSDSPWSKRRSKTNKSIAKKQLQLAANKNILAKSATISAWFHPASKIVFPLNINELRFSRRRNWVVLWKFLPKTVSRLWTLCEV